MDDTLETALNALETSVQTRRSRRTFLQGAALAGVAASSVSLLEATGAHAQSTAADTPAAIFNIAATAERLAVTFYGNGVANAGALGLTATELNQVKAALIEEQIHLTLFESVGGKALADTFSFPAGAKTFTDLATFISTQQALEGAFDSAFIAASYEFAQLGRADLARLAIQIAMIESEHRALGRDIAGNHNVSLVAAFAGTASPFPADNWAFAPQTVPSVGAAPGVLTAAGFLSPVAGNTYPFKTADFTSADLAAVYAKIDFKTPFVAGTTPTAATPVKRWHARGR